MMKRSKFFVLICTMAIAFGGLCGCLPDHTITDPVACIKTSADSFSAEDTVKFESCSQFASSYEWNFGDSTAISKDENPTHTYAKAGVYTVTLKVSTNSGSNTNTATKIISISERAKYAIIKSIKWTNGSVPWDEGKGPDVYLAIGSSPSSLNRYSEIQILKQTNMPSGLRINTDTDMERGSYTFALMDDDSPQDPQMMYSWDKVTVGTSPEIHLMSPDGSFDIVIQTKY